VINFLIRAFMLASVGLGLAVAQVLRVAGRPKSCGKQMILVVRLDQTLGDSVMNSSLLRELRRGHPDAEISVVVHPRIYEMVKFCPYVDNIYCYDWGTSLPKSLLIRHFLAVRFWWQHLRTKRFDVALVPRLDEDHHAAMVALFSGARRRIGYASATSERKRLLNAGFDKLFTEVIPTCGEVKHEVERNLDVLRRLGITPQSAELEFWCGEADHAFAQTHFPPVDGERPYYVGLGLSGGYSPLKRWPVEKYVELASLIVAQNPTRKVRFVLVGGKDDVELGRIFEKACPDTINLIDQTSILQMGAVLKKVDLFIGNDSGSMHVAAAAGARVLGIFGSSCHHRFSAWGARCNSVSLELSCGPCGKGHGIDRCSVCIYSSPKCMDELSPAFVLKQLKFESQHVIPLAAHRASCV
jgi:ADP-heptose:LPS heptosyltransferase